MIELSRIAALLFRTDFVQSAAPSIADVQQLVEYEHIFPEQLRQGMEEELPQYVANAAHYRMLPFECSLEFTGRRAVAWWEPYVQRERLGMCAAVAGAARLAAGAVAFSKVEAVRQPKGKPSKARLHFQLQISTSTEASAVKEKFGGSFAEGAMEAMLHLGGWQQALVLVSAKAEVDYFNQEMASVLAHWKQWGSKVPSWSRAARRIMSFTPSSACVERIFSYFKNSFSHLQMKAMQDYVALPVMLQYNSRGV